MLCGNLVSEEQYLANQTPTLLNAAYSKCFEPCLVSGNNLFAAVNKRVGVGGIIPFF